MHTFDRYVLRLFIKVVLVCFISTTGLYIVIDSCNNLDEFLGYGQQQDGVLGVLVEYYSARVPWFFDRISALLALIAAMFAISWLQRTNEMTALLAAGVSKSRIIKPLVAAAILISFLAAANREFVLPVVRDKLTRNAQDWMGQQAQKVEPVTDNQTDILINGRHTFASDRRIESPNFRLHRRLPGFGRKIAAENAYYQDANEHHHGGYLLDGVEESVPLSEIASVVDEGDTIVYSPADTSWLEPDQCFVSSEVTFEQLAGGSAWRQWASTWNLIRGLRNPSLAYGLDTQVTIHSRIVQPFLDVSLLFLGLPLVLTRENRNVFVAAGWCLLVVVGFILIVMGCHALGNSGYLMSPATAAWLPLIIFAPVATAVSQPIWE